jgi:hypothetical protein
MVLSLMATALLASALARWVTRPMYVELAAIIVPPPAPSPDPGMAGSPPAQPGSPDR